MDRYFAGTAQPFDWSPQRKERCWPERDGTLWDTTATIYHPTRKGYWQGMKCIKSMTFAQRDALLARHLRRLS